MYQRKYLTFFYYLLQIHGGVDMSDLQRFIDYRSLLQIRKWNLILDGKLLFVISNIRLSFWIDLIADPVLGLFFRKYV